MEFINFLNEQNVFTFLFLFARMSGLMTFLPFYSHMQIPIVIKMAMILFFSFLFFPMAELNIKEIHIASLALGIAGELMLGLIAGLALNLIFGALQFAGLQISFIMGFTMASVMDPQTGTSVPLISQIFSMIALILFLLFDGHHIILLFYQNTMGTISLGSFYPSANMWDYLSNSMANLFILGFVLSFPIIGLSLLSDLIFGMLMKTMPQFNLLVVGFPIKIMLAFAVMLAVFSSMMFVFKQNILKTLNDIPSLFF